jgi:predicted nucleic acid-binding Zn ribbon protein
MAKQAQVKHSTRLNRDQRRMRWQKLIFSAMAIILILSWVISLLVH